jgi:hypothetical protein
MNLGDIGSRRLAPSPPEADSDAQGKPTAKDRLDSGQRIFASRDGFEHVNGAEAPGELIRNLGVRRLTPSHKATVLAETDGKR